MKSMVFALMLVALATPGCKKSASGSPSAGVVPITADENGFSPASVTLTKGETATLRFTRTTDQTCADKVVFPDLKLEKDLPLNTPVDIAVETKEARTLTFQCGMGMFKSKVVIR